MEIVSLSDTCFIRYLFKKDYKLIKNLFISRAIIKSKIQYEKAFLKRKYENNDLTYFILYLIKTLDEDFSKMMDY